MYIYNSQTVVEGASGSERKGIDHQVVQHLYNTRSTPIFLPSFSYFLASPLALWASSCYRGEGGMKINRRDDTNRDHPPRS